MVDALLIRGLVPAAIAALLIYRLPVVEALRA